MLSIAKYHYTFYLMTNTLSVRQYRHKSTEIQFVMFLYSRNNYAHLISVIYVL